MHLNWDIIQFATKDRTQQNRTGTCQHTERDTEKEDKAIQQKKKK